MSGYLSRTQEMTSKPSISRNIKSVKTAAYRRSPVSVSTAATPEATLTISLVNCALAITCLNANTSVASSSTKRTGLDFFGMGGTCVASVLFEEGRSLVAAHWTNGPKSFPACPIKTPVTSNVSRAAANQVEFIHVRSGKTARAPGTTPGSRPHAGSHRSPVLAGHDAVRRARRLLHRIFSRPSHLEPRKYSV